MTDAEATADTNSRSDTARRRRFASGIVALLFIAVLAAANPALWFATSLSSTDVFVETFAPLPSDEQVAAALADRFTNAVFAENDIAAAVADPLPDSLQFIAAPLAEGVRGLVADTAQSVIQSDDFTRLWEGVLRVSHGTALWVVDKGDEGAVQVEDGAIVLDLSELLVAVSDRLEQLSFDVLADKAAGATVVIYDTDGEGFIATLIRAINAIRWIAPVLTVILAVGAIALAVDRRRMVMWLGLGASLAMLATLVGFRAVRDAAVSGIVDPVQRDGLAAGLGIVSERFVAQTIIVLIVGAVAAGVAWLMGSSTSALAIRGAFSGTSTGDAAATTWIAGNARALQVAAVALGFAFLLFAPTTGLLAIVVTVGLVGGIVAVLQRFVTG